MAASGASHDGDALLFEHKQSEASKAKLEATHKASDSKPSHAQQCDYKINLSKDIVDQVASNIDKAKKALGSFQEHENYHAQKLAE